MSIDTLRSIGKVHFFPNKLDRRRILIIVEMLRQQALRMVMHIVSECVIEAPKQMPGSEKLPTRFGHEYA